MIIVASTAFGLILPRLILHTRFGLAVAFALHWTFYAAVLAQARIFGPHVASSVVAASGMSGLYTHRPEHHQCRAQQPQVAPPYRALGYAFGGLCSGLPL